jgi:branched-chain amino acid transport system substrate-binding protein
MIGTNAGPSELAGKMCHELFFTTSWQNDQAHEATGKYMSDRRITGVYAMAPDYPGGRDAIAGFKRYFKGKIVREVYTRLGEPDYQAEIGQLRAAKPKAVFAFYPTRRYVSPSVSPAPGAGAANTSASATSSTPYPACLIATPPM